ncbi:hypothetical protein FOCC_FOCC014548 [Frankliniella occidentalis]|nr:hypothetical protein FOCC_FOCC014548 [Frankliniella occidentalis]
MHQFYCCKEDWVRMPCSYFFLPAVWFEEDHGSAVHSSEFLENLELDSSTHMQQFLRTLIRAGVVCDACKTDQIMKLTVEIDFSPRAQFVMLATPYFNAKSSSKLLLQQEPWLIEAEAVTIVVF